MNARSFLLLAPLALVATGAGCTSDRVTAAPAMEATVAEDTALLGSEAVRIAGLRVEPVRSGPWHDEWSGPGRLSLDPATTQPLGAVVAGRVVRVLAQPGDRVVVGQVLATIHSHEMLDALSARAAARAAVVRAANAARLAASAAERAERLYAAKALSLAELERARAGGLDAVALHGAASAEAARTTEMVAHLVGVGPVPAGVEPHEVLVRAPLDGVVMARDAQPGQVVTVGQPLLTVSRPDHLQLVLQLPERALAAATVGSAVRFTVQAYPTREWRATVTRVMPGVDPVTRTVEVLARVVDTEGALRPEMFATARLAGPGGPSVLTVSAGAVQAMEGDTVLVVAEQRGEGLHLRAVPVRIGRRTTTTAEVLAGVEDGTRVVAEGAAVARAEIMRRREAGSEE